MGRFAQADSIIPGAGNSQAWDRYAYTNNNPVMYTDPSGHMPDCDGKSGYQCKIATRKWAQANRPTQDLPDYGGYFGCGDDLECRDMTAHGLGITLWEYNIFDALYSSGQVDAVHGVNYMLSNGVRIRVGERFYGSSGEWQSLGSTAGWFDPTNNYVVLNPNAGYESGKMPNIWGLATIVHEAKHLEQGFPLTKYKELEAWQITFRIAESLGHYGPDGIEENTITDQIYNLPLSSDEANIDEFSNLVREYNFGYWLFFLTLRAR